MTFIAVHEMHDTITSETVVKIFFLKDLAFLWDKKMNEYESEEEHCEVVGCTCECTHHCFVRFDQFSFDSCEDQY